MPLASVARPVLRLPFWCFLIISSLWVGRAQAQSGLPNELRFIFKQTISGVPNQDESAIIFLAGGSVGRDAFDAPNLASPNVDGASVPVPNVELAINVMPELTQRFVIPLTFNTAVGTPRVVFYGFNSFPLGTKFYLRDSLLHQTIQLGVDGSGNLADSTLSTFTVTSNPASEGRRFTLIFEPGSTVVCPSIPTPTSAGITRCGPGNVSVSIGAIPNGCGAEWFLASTGTTGTPLATGTTFTRNLAVSDTILVRYSCSTVCTTGFARIPVTIEMSPFNIRLTPTSGTLRDTIRIKGNLLSMVDQVTLARQPLAFTRSGDTSLAFTVPNSAVTGLVRVVDAGGAACPDSAQFQFVAPVCNTPTASVTRITRCGPGFVTVTAAGIPRGCDPAWYLASQGATGTPISTAAEFSVFLTASDTLLLRTLCGITCTSAVARRIPITIQSSPFRPVLQPDSGRVGDVITITGAQFDLISRISLGNQNLAISNQTPTSLQVTIPVGVGSGYIVLHSDRVCKDSAAFRLIDPLNCSQSVTHRVNKYEVMCRQTEVNFLADSAIPVGCTYQWSLASTHSVVSTDLEFERNFNAPDTVYLRRYCSGSCISPTVVIPIRVSTAGFAIILEPDSARLGDTIRVKGDNIDRATSFRLNQISLVPFEVTPTAASLVIPPMARTGDFRVTDATGMICASAAGFTVIQDPCRTPPPVTVSGGAFCGVQTLLVNVTVRDTAEVEWFRTSQGLTNPVETGFTYTGLFGRSDTLLVRKTYSPGCTTFFSTIPVTILTSPLQARLMVDSGRAGTPFTVLGSGFGSLTSVTFDQQPINYTLNSATSLTAQVPVGAAPGTYRVRLSANGFCSDSVTFKVVLITSSGAPKASGELLILPNPAHEVVTVTVPPDYREAVIELVDISGRILRSIPAQGKLASVPVSLKGVSPGLYHLRVKTQDRVWLEKLVVE